MLKLDKKNWTDEQIKTANLLFHFSLFVNQTELKKNDNKISTESIIKFLKDENNNKIN